MKDQTTDSLALSLEHQVPFLARLARALVHDEHAAEDLVQDTLTSAWAQARKDKGGGLASPSPASLRAWLATTLRRRSIDRRRVRRPALLNDAEGVQTNPSLGASTDAVAERLERQRLVHNALAALPEKFQTALVLRYQDGMSAAAIASSTETPVPTIKSRLSRGLELLREELDRSSGGGAEGRERWLAALTPLARLDYSVASVATPVVSAGVGASPWLFAWLLKPAALAIVAAGLLAATWIFSRPTKGPAEAAETVATAREVDPALNLAAEGAAPVPSSARVALGEAKDSPGDLIDGSQSNSQLLAQTEPVTVIARLLSTTSGAPVPALVKLPKGEQATASPIDGAVALNIVPRDTPELTISHPDFLTCEIPLEPWAQALSQGGTIDLGILELEPANKVTVTVVDGSQRPIPRATVRLHRRLTQELSGNEAGPRPEDHPRQVGESDQHGQVRFPLANAVTATVITEDGRMGAGLVIAGDDRVIRVHGLKRTIRFTSSGDGSPVVNRAFPIGWQEDASEAGWFIHTDAQGQALIPSGTGTLTLCMSMPRLLIDAVSIDGQAVSGLSTGAFSAQATLESSNQIVQVEAGNQEAEVRLVNARTGEPVSGRAFFHEQSLRSARPKDSGEAAEPSWSGVRTDRHKEVVDGRLMLHRWFSDGKENAENRRRWIAVAGYSLKILDGGSPLAGQTIEMEPAHSRRLRILDESGRPVTTRASVVLPHGIQLGVSTDAAGRTMPLPWTMGDEWECWAHGLGAPGDHDSQRISSEMLAANETVTLQHAVEGGAIRITGVPQGAPPIFARTKHGWPVAASPASSTAVDALGSPGWIIQGLPPGQYVVGPHEWVEQLQSRLLTDTPSGDGSAKGQAAVKAETVRIVPGKTVEVPWDERWRGASSVEGRVICEGHPGGEIAALPLYGAVGTKIYFGSHGPWRYCDSEGRFRTAPGAPEPVGFIFARFHHDWSGREPQILDSQRVREDGVYRIALTSFELVASNAAEWQAAELGPRSLPTVWLVGDEDVLDAPMDFIHGFGWGRWNPAEPLTRKMLPAHISKLRVTFGRGREPMIIPIEPGAHARAEVVIELPDSEAASKREGPALGAFR